MDRDTIFETMKTMNFGDNLIKMIRVLYKDSQATIITNDVIGASFTTKGGVKQGCPLTP